MMTYLGSWDMISDAQLAILEQLAIIIVILWATAVPLMQQRRILFSEQLNERAGGHHDT
jgi:hypothetical protein